MELKRCFICGKYTWCDKHHIFNGHGTRAHSEEDMLFVPLCRPCHDAVHTKRDLRDLLKKFGQIMFERWDTHEAFMLRYHHNYLDEGDSLENVTERIAEYGRKTNACQDHLRK